MKNIMKIKKIFKLILKLKIRIGIQIPIYKIFHQICPLIKLNTKTLYKMERLYSNRTRINKSKPIKSKEAFPIFTKIKNITQKIKKIIKI